MLGTAQGGSRSGHFLRFPFHFRLADVAVTMTGRDEKMAPRITETLRLFTALLLIAAISRGQTADVNLVSGSDYTLSPNYRGDFNEIIWLVNDIKVVELELNETQQPIYYKTFPRLRAGASLNNQTGALTIPKLTISDTGKYKAEVKLHDLNYNYTYITLTVLDPVETPIITKQTTEGWITLNCQSNTSGVTYKWEDDKGNNVSNEETYTIPKPTEAAVTLICIASNQVSKRSASVTIEPPGGLSGWDIAKIIGGIFVLSFIVNNFKKIGGRNHYGVSRWDIAGIIVGIFVAILIVVTIFEKIRWRYRDGLSGRDITGIIVGIIFAILIVVIIFEKIRWRDHYGLCAGDIAGIIVGIFVVVVLIFVIIFEMIRGDHYGLSGWDIAGIIVWIFVIIFIVVIIFEKIRWRYCDGRLGNTINKCCPPFPYFPCLIRALRVNQTTSPYKTWKRHLSECTRDPCCIGNELIAWIFRARPNKAKDLLTHIAECNRNPCCIRENVKPNNEDNRTQEKQELLLKNIAKDEENAGSNDARLNTTEALRVGQPVSFLDLPDEENAEDNDARLNKAKDLLRYYFEFTQNPSFIQNLLRYYSEFTQNPNFIQNRGFAGNNDARLNMADIKSLPE